MCVQTLKHSLLRLLSSARALYEWIDLGRNIIECCTLAYVHVQHITTSTKQPRNMANKDLDEASGRRAQATTWTQPPMKVAWWGNRNVT